MTDDFENHDLEGLARMRADVPPPGPAVLAAARQRLLDQDVRPAVLVPRRTRTLRPAHRRALVGLGAAAAVAAIAAGSFALTGTDTHPSPQAVPGSTSSPGASGAPSASTSAPVHFVNAAQVLDAAAAGARANPVPTAGQYLHVREHDYGISQIEEPPDNGAYELTENRNDTWTPATKGIGYERNDNNITVTYPTKKQRAFAKVSPGGIPERELTWYEIDPAGRYTQVYPTLQRDPASVPCTSCDTSVWDSPDADTSLLSRDPAQLRASLYTWAKKTYRELVAASKGDQFTVDDLAYDGATTVVTRSDLPGDLRAELYRVIKTIPGITLIGSLANYDGVTGIAIGRTDTFHVQHDLIFTDNGSTYIGDRTTVRKPSRLYHVKAGTLIGASAVTVSVSGKPAVPRR